MKINKLKELVLILVAIILVVFLIKYLDVLKDSERNIIIKRYGLFNEKEATQKEIANEMGISRSYVSRRG